ncbi:MAG TPA: hypothetical protein VKY37_03265 [Brumimicrobium sp.]|nr:hypothetical protein [Brumimicrobium sp.]
MNSKVVYNRRKISTEEIRKFQDFDALSKMYKKDSYWQWKSIEYWGTVVSTAVALLFLVLYI